MKEFQAICYFSKDDSFKVNMEAESIQVVIETIEKWILENNFYRSSFDISAEIYNMNSVIYFKVSEFN